MLNAFMQMEDADRWRGALREFIEKYRAHVDPAFNETKWSRMAGLPQSTLNKFMNGGSTTLEYRTLEKLAKALNMKVGVIMGDIGFYDSADQNFDPIPDSLKKLMTPLDVEILKQTVPMDPETKATASNILKALPSAGVSDPKPRKESKK